MKIIIVGGVAGGASAAARLRRLLEDAEIILIERGPDVSFANCGMPYYVGGKITNRDKLLVVTPQRMRERYRLDVRVRTTVEAIDRDNQRVRVVEAETGRSYEESYDKLVLAPGAAPLRPPIPGIDLPGIFTLRNLSDMDRIKSAVQQGVRHVEGADASPAREVVIVGAGFIGLELAENMRALDIATTIVELQDQVLPPFDKEMTTPLLTALQENDVSLHLGDSVVGFEAQPEGIAVALNSGKRLSAQVVALGIGVRPENHLAVEAGIEVGPRGGIQTNAHMQTNDPNIYAVGDVIEVQDFVLQQPTQVPLAGPANRQGRIAADHIAGRPTKYRGTQGTSILGLFDATAAMTGASEKALQRAQRPYEMVYVHPANHAGYYPGAEQMTLKLLCEPVTGRILGAQAVGGDGVDKRIDVIAIAIQAGMTVFDLEESELAYAPQYGSAKDPVNMAGFVASGLLRGDHPQIDVGKLLAMAPADRPLLLDVRTPDEYKAGHIPEAVNIPIDELRSRLGELPADADIAAYCQVGMRGYLATRILLQSGRKVRNISGGYRTFLLWKHAFAEDA